MNTMQRVNLKNLIKSINDEDIHNFFIDKNNIISIEVRGDEFRVSVNNAYLIFQKGNLLDYMIDRIDEYIIKEQRKEKIRKILGDENKVDEEFLKQCKEESDGIFRNESTYDYKKNLENLRKNLITEIVDCENSFEEQNYNNDYLDGRIGAYEEILRYIDSVIENKQIKER